MIELEEILYRAVDAGWAHGASIPRASFSGTMLAAARAAIELYKQHMLQESERIAELTERVRVLEDTLTRIGCAVSLSFDKKLSPDEQLRILTEVHAYMTELQQVKIERGSYSRKLNDAEHAIAEALQLMLNKEQLRLRFRADAHWIRFIRDLRHTLKNKE